ncbi:MAG: hypothetical protein A2046_03440 [Bacteroidetes bacterium GWA2_30_7]|nr:MAG: hypothetical protein A2046_03440 [Bacteroidetes bacterium GWA2_30_7]
MRFFILLISIIAFKCSYSIEYATVKTGAECTELYFPELKGKTIAVVANQTSIIGKSHLVDSLLSAGIKIKKIFCPEHGFRGNADAGAHIANYIDEKTKIPVISLYGNKMKPSADDLVGIDIIVFDIQDVGVRFYTYISTMHYVMESCAENKIPLMILDRPNPNGFYVDGPVLDIKHKSFVGMHTVALVHGMTIAEYAQMINNEGWLTNGLKCELKYILCEGYTHKSLYNLPVKPSPNLSTMNSVFLYPSLGLFEGTVMSVGRGTDFPFQVVGHPTLKAEKFSFTPVAKKGASMNPPYKGQVCYGFDLRNLGEDYMFLRKQIDLQWLITSFKEFTDKKKYFNSFFTNLAGTPELKTQIIGGLTEDEIRKSWEPKLAEFKEIRKKYLLYEDFE